jgi:Fe-S cluster assembly protein SufD
MTVVLAKTPAETALSADFKARAAELPGGGTVAAARAAAMAAFEKQGLPHRRIEAWKYTDLRNALAKLAPIATHDDATVSLADVNVALGPLSALDADRIVFVNGSYRAELSTAKPQTPITTLGAGLRAGKAAYAIGLGDGEAVVALNTALVTDGANIEIKANSKLDKPIMLINLAAGATAKLVTLRHSVAAGVGATGAVIEVHARVTGASAGQCNVALALAAAAGASLTHILVTHPGADATHLETVAATLGTEATLKSFQFTSGTGLVRNQSFVRFDGEHAKLDISGLMLARGREHIDTTLVIDHAVPHCESRELFKTVLDDTARSVFQGKVIVRPDAQKTDGKQMANALMLSEACEFDSKPELEIYADDVVCGHGATVAEIDPAQMFYLRSRGIPEDQSRAMLIESFAAAALEKIEDEHIREALGKLASVWFASKRVA